MVTSARHSHRHWLLIADALTSSRQFCAFIAFCSFSKARTSIWRTRSREMLYCCDRSSSVVGLSFSRRSIRMWRSRSFSVLQRAGQQGLAAGQLLAIGERGLLAFGLVDQPVLPLALAVLRAPARSGCGPARRGGGSC